MRILFIFICCLNILHAVTIATPDLDVEALDKKHIKFDTVVKHIVKKDGVDYKLLHATYKSQLDYYRKQLAVSSIPKDQSERMAFYINAYNALTLALVLELAPKDQTKWRTWSVTKANEFWKNYTFDVHGQWMSLDHIEHKILRPMGDPRIHFAVNCASQSCPPLLNTAYTGGLLDQQLRAQTQQFMKSPYHLRLVDNKLYINPILKWFASDFKSAGGVDSYLIKHAQRNEIKAYLQQKGKVAYFDYDWSLNIHRPASSP